MPVILYEKGAFPDPRTADEEGLVAVGGSLSVDRLLAAYRSGIFPWTAKPVTWWSPDPRAIFDLNLPLHIPRSLKRSMRRQTYRVTLDNAFSRVIAECAAPAPGRNSTWIEPEFISAYTHLHELGHAHSLECWFEDRLVSGIYGVAIGGFFAGESMFHRVSDASKVALVRLVDHLRGRGYTLFDIQMLTPTTSSLGAITISREDYLRRLEVALRRPCRFVTATV